MTIYRNTYYYTKHCVDRDHYVMLGDPHIYCNVNTVTKEHDYSKLHKFHHGLASTDYMYLPEPSDQRISLRKYNTCS